jgi:hypothetical protein
MKRLLILAMIVALLFSSVCYSQAPSADRYSLTNIQNVKESGARGNGINDDTIAFIASAAKSINNIVFVPRGTYIITSDVTFGASVEVWFGNGVTIDIANIKTLTISGKLHSPYLPTITGAGTFNYSAASIPSVTVGGALEWYTGNVTYVPLTGNIQTYITNAVAGDTLILASGVYTITDTITVNKQLNIKGQGCSGFVTAPITPSHGTLISCATASKTAFSITNSNVRISDLSINMTGASSTGISTANNLVGIVIMNIDVIINSSGLILCFNILGSDTIIRDSSFHLTSTDSYCAGIYANNNSSTTQNAIVDCFTVTGTTIGGPGIALNYCYVVYNNNDANTITLNMFACVAKSVTGSTDNSAAVAFSTTTNNAVLNTYGCTLNGATYDVKQLGTNVVNINGCTLINGTTNGTITQSGKLMSGSLSVTATANNLLYASAANTISGLATGNSGVLVTSGAGVPSIAVDIPTAVTIGGNYVYRATGTDIPVTDGGTGASDAGTARTNLGLGTIAVLNSPLPTANGGSVATQTVRFHSAEFTPSPDAVNNNCIVSDGYDRINYRSYFEVNSGSATQDYDMVAIVKLPVDFVSFTANAISLDIYTIDFATSVATVTVYKNDNSVDVNAPSVISTADTTWQTKTVAPAMTGYTAGDNVKILIHIGTGDTASDYVRIARVYYTYNTR